MAIPAHPGGRATIPLRAPPVQPKIPLQIQVAADIFYIDLTPKMPTVELRATFNGATADPAAVTWHVSLDYVAFIPVPHAVVRKVRTKAHPPIAPLKGNPVVIPFATLMCGKLSVKVEVAAAGAPLVATRDLLIGGMNPNGTLIHSTIALRIVRQMIQQESGMKQFSDRLGGAWAQQSVNPNWSSDGERGVGLGQLTNPPPGDDDIWNWRANARHLQDRFTAFRAHAASLHTRIMATRRFQGEVKALADWRKAEGQAPVSASLPPLSSDQLDQEAARAYNGFGKRIPSEYLSYTHEFEPMLAPLTSRSRKDAAGHPLLSPPVPVVDANGAARWRQVPGAERISRSGGHAPGDPLYVEHVLAQPG